MRKKATTRYPTTATTYHLCGTYDAAKHSYPDNVVVVARLEAGRAPGGSQQDLVSPGSPTQRVSTPRRNWGPAREAGNDPASLARHGR